jgi:hypothetical protein
MVYAAFESILAMPEVQAVVGNKMVELGHKAEAELLERHTNADRDYAHEQMRTLFNKADSRKPERLFKAVQQGNMCKETALSLMPSNSVYYRKTEAISND